MSKCASIRVATLGLALAILVSAAHAQPRITWHLYGSILDSGQPSIASPQPLSALVAWEEGGHVWSSLTGVACVGQSRDGQWQYDHGPGTAPETGVLGFQAQDHIYITAFVRGDSLVVREGDGESSWATVAVAYLGAAQPMTSRLDLWCSRHPEFPAWAWLTLWSDSSSGGGILLLRRTELGWGSLQSVPGTGSAMRECSFPQATEHVGPDSPLPRIFYIDLEEDSYLKHVDLLIPGGWSTPVAHTGIHAFGGAFDVARSRDGYVFLATGLQPTCPCNTISFCEWTDDGGWLDPIPLTVDTDDYDWPHSPRIGVDADADRLHALWFQIGSDGTMTPRHKRMYYWQRDGSLWEDHSGDLADQQDTGLDSDVSLSIDSNGEAAFAWARRDTVGDVPQPSVVWFSFFDYCALGAGDAPSLAVAMTAAPNPFNPSVELSATSERPLVAVEIFDARGQRVAALTPTPDSGSWRAIWDGRDARGRALPSGAYLARVRDETGATASCKLVLAR
jgi:hypothetical protein